MFRRTKSISYFLGMLAVLVLGITMPKVSFAQVCTFSYSGYGACTQQGDGSWRQYRSVTSCQRNGKYITCLDCANQPHGNNSLLWLSCTPPYTYSWSAGDFGACTGGTGTWSYGAWAPTTGCGVTDQTRGASCSANYNSAYQTRPVMCMRSDGVPVGEEYCSAGSKPATGNYCTPTSGYNCGPQEATYHQSYMTNSCSYSWDIGGWGAYASSCSDYTTRTRSVSCRQSNGEIVADALCVANVGAKPAISESAANYAGCSYAWSAGSFGGCAAGGTGTWSSGAWAPTTGCGTVTQSRTNSCSPNANSSSQTRSVSCIRSGTGAVVDNGYCNAGTMPTTVQACTPSAGYSCGVEPATSQQTYLTNSCSYSWQVGAWSPYADRCSDFTSRSRSVTCQQSNGEVVDDGLCIAAAGEKPETSQSGPVYGGCSYSWSAGSYGSCADGGSGAWSSGAWAPTTGCGTVTQTRTNTCAPHRNTSSQTRSVICIRNGTGAVVDNGFCNAGLKPSTTQACTPSAGYRCPAEPATSQQTYLTNSCSYSWDVGGWGAYASSCSDNTTRTRSVTCRQSNGEVANDGLCIAADGAKPAASESGSNYAGCQYEWVAPDFDACTGGTAHWDYGAWSPATGCGMTEQTRSSSCIQDAGSGTQSRTVSCRRVGTGEIVDNSLCTGAGTAPLTSQSCTPTGVSCGNAEISRTELLTDTCGYSWAAGAWSTPASSCSLNTPITRSVACQRSDGEVVDVALCASAGPKPATSSTTPEFSSCTYSWSNPSWGEWSSTCSVNASRTRTPGCHRSDGANTVVADGFCDAGSRPESAQTQEVTSSCTWQWEQSGWEACAGGTFEWLVGEWSPTAGCGLITQARSVSCAVGNLSGSQERSVVCRRADGTLRPDSECAGVGVKPETTQSCTPSAAVCGAAPVGSQQVELNSTCGNPRIMSVCRDGTESGKFCVVSPF